MTDAEVGLIAVRMQETPSASPRNALACARSRLPRTAALVQAPRSDFGFGSPVTIPVTLA